MTGLRPLEADPPAYAGGTPNIAVITAVVALRLSAPAVFPTRRGSSRHPESRPLAAAVADRAAFGGTKTLYPARLRRTPKNNETYAQEQQDMQGRPPVTMSETNKQLARDYFQAFLKRDEAWWESHIAPEFRRHDPGLPFEVIGPAGVKRLADALPPWHSRHGAAHRGRHRGGRKGAGAPARERHAWRRPHGCGGHRPHDRHRGA